MNNFPCLSRNMGLGNGYGPEMQDYILLFIQGCGWIWAGAAGLYSIVYPGMWVGIGPEVQDYILLFIHG